MRSALPTLPEEENNELLRKAKDGDLAAKDKFFAHNERLMMYIAKKFDSIKEMSYEDRISATQLGFLKAYNTYSFDKDTRFATYSSRCMENEVLMFVRSNKRHQGVMSLDEIMYSSGDNDSTITLEDTLVSPTSDMYDDFVESAALKDALAEFSRTAKERDRKIIHLRFEENLSQKDIAAQLKISQSYISRLEKRALEGIKKIMERQAKGEIEMGNKIGAKIKWMFLNTTLSNSDIAKIFSVPTANVLYYRRKLNAGELKYAEDPSARKLLGLLGGAMVIKKEEQQAPKVEVREEQVAEVKEIPAPVQRKERKEKPQRTETPQEVSSKTPSVISMSVSGTDKQSILKHLEYITSLLKSDEEYKFTISIESA